MGIIVNGQPASKFNAYITETFCFKSEMLDDYNLGEEEKAAVKKLVKMAAKEKPELSERNPKTFVVGIINFVLSNEIKPEDIAVNSRYFKDLLYYLEKPIGKPGLFSGSASESKPVNTGNLNNLKIPDLHHLLMDAINHKDKKMVGQILARLRQMQQISMPNHYNSIYSKLREYAGDYFRSLQSYPEMFKSDKPYSAVYGPVNDVMPVSKELRQKTILYQQGRTRLSSAISQGGFSVLTMMKAPGAVFIGKHAPGIGYVTKEPEWEDEIADLRLPKSQIEEQFKSFEIFRGFNNRTAVMVSGVFVPALEEHTAKPIPFTLSPKGIGYVREKLGQDVVTVTDDIGSRAFKGYYKSENRGELYTAPWFDWAVNKTVKADVDMVLIYSDDPIKTLNMWISAGKAQVASGQISRADLEKSVFRILKLKKDSFSDHSFFKERKIEDIVKKMSIDQLLAQKIVLPAYSGIKYWDKAGPWFRAWIKLWERGVGGIALEGIKPETAVRLKQMLNERGTIGNEIPPLVINNSPQELSGKENKFAKKYYSEIKAIDQFNEIAESIPPQILEKMMWNIIYDVAEQNFAK